MVAAFTGLLIPMYIYFKVAQYCFFICMFFAFNMRYLLLSIN